MKRAIAFALAAVLIISGCSSSDENGDQSELANPASVYCEQQGGTVDIRTDESGGQIGYCVFADGTEVEEWAYYRGEAQPALPGQ
jgi:putative hemolysin